jgi:hypothetical protein
MHRAPESATAAHARRTSLAAAGGAITITLLPSLVSAAPESVAAEIKKLFGDKSPTEGKIKIDLHRSPRMASSCHSGSKSRAQ